MTEAQVPVPALPDVGAKPNPFARIVGVLTSPGETFASIAGRPDWLVPLLIIMVISIAGGVLIAGHVDFRDLGREGVEMNPKSAQMSASQMDAAAGFTATMIKVSAYASPALSVLVLVIVAAALLYTLRAFGAEGDFRQAFSATVYAWFPRVIKGVLAVVVIMSRKSLSIVDLQNPLMSNLGFLFDAKTQPLAYAFVSSFDLFAIWSVILLIIGFAALSRVTRSRAAAVVIGWWVVVNLFTLIGPAMQALRR